jgi:hypothetical protein
MPARAQRVVPPFNARGVYLLSLIFGLLSGLPAHALERWAFRIAVSQFIQAYLNPFQANILASSLSISTVFITPVLIGLWLSCLSQRRGQTAAAAALAGVAMLLASLFAAMVLWSVHGGTDWHDWPLPAFLINLIIIAAVSAGVALLVRWLIRSLLFTIVEQDGTLCPRCGYRLGSAAITTCPECGTPADAPVLAFVRLHRASGWLQRRASLLAALLGAAMLVPLAIALHYRTLPAARFLAAFPRTENTGRGIMMLRNQPSGWHDSSCMTAWVPLAGNPTRALIILYIPDRRSPLPPMRLAVAATPVPPLAANMSPQINYGSPEIGCDLPRELAERIIREGLPPALIQALAAEANRTNWKPTSLPNGLFTASPQTYWIDPSPSFSAP